MSFQALPLVDVDATGKVTFKNVGSNSERITATPNQEALAMYTKSCEELVGERRRGFHDIQPC